MILQALCQYYDRLCSDPESDIALPGFSAKQIHFALVVTKDGELRSIKDIRDYEGKKPRAVELIVPEEVVRAGKPTAESAKPNFLWDNTGYALGVDDKGKPENTATTFAAFKAFHHALGDACGDDGMRAVLSFLDHWDPEKLDTFAAGREMVESKANVVFLLEGDREFVHQRPVLKDLWLQHRSEMASTTMSTCLVTGERRPIARLHPKIKGVQDAQSIGASIVSFNLEAFRSYNKEQNYNAPIGEDSAFAYTTALNRLLGFGSKQKIQLGDATTVFWTERESPVESIWGEMFAGPKTSTDAADDKAVHDYLSAVRAGRHPPGIDTTVRMYVLGLSPNRSRLSVRFWLADTLEAFDRHLGMHFENLRIERKHESDKEFPGMWHLLMETLPKKAELRKAENLNPLLAGMLTRAILTGGRYPDSLLATIIRRLWIDGDASYYRLALTKAILQRNYQKEVTMGLDEENESIAYRLGRLFAVLEKAQEEAIAGANATIRDRYYASASATPGVVFPQLLRMSQHHLSKIAEGSRITKEKLIQAIVGGIPAFPRHLKLEDQGLFALGYYHQRNTFFQRKSSNT